MLQTNGLLSFFTFLGVVSRNQRNVMDQHTFIERLGTKIKLLSANLQVSTPNLATHTHAHSAYCILLTTAKGKGYCTVGTTRYVLSSGTVHVVFPNEVHKYIADSENPYTVYFLHITWFGENPHINRVSKIAKGHVLNSLFKQITDLYEHIVPPTGEIRKYALMCLILSELFDLSQASQDSEKRPLMPPAMDGRIQLALRQLGGPPFEFPGISRLASLLGMSKRTFLTFFRNNVGITAREFFLQNRMAYAKSLLDSQEYTKKEIAVLCGYSNTQNFTRAYRNFMEKNQGTIIWRQMVAGSTEGQRQ